MTMRWAEVKELAGMLSTLAVLGVVGMGLSSMAATGRDVVEVEAPAVEAPAVPAVEQPAAVDPYVVVGPAAAAALSLVIEPVPAPRLPVGFPLGV